MSTAAETKKGLLANAFSGHYWDSRIKSQNTTKAEMWLGYVLGPWGMLLTNSIVNSYFNQYLTDVVGFTISKGLWIATFMVLFPLISKLLDAITNIVMSRLIDSTVCRQGKARPWIILSAPLVFISIILLFWMPFANVYAQAVWVIVAYNLYYSVAYTMWNMSKELTVAVSTRNVLQRRKLATASSLVMTMGTGLVSILFPTMLTAVVRSLAGGSNAKGYFYAMSMIACIALPLAFVQYFHTRERITEERRNQLGVTEAGHEEIKKEVSFREQAKACLKDKYWIIFILVVLVYWIIANTRTISLVYYSGWVVNGNQYGRYEVVQRNFQIIAMQPMFLGVFIVFPLMRKWGRGKTIWVGSTLTIIGSIIAFIGAGSSMKVYAGTALAGFGNVAFSYLLMTFLGDVIDHVEWKTGVRCDGFTAAFYGAAVMFAVGIAQGILNLGLMATGYTQPAEVGVAETGVKLFADQPAAATGWINFCYQGSFIIMGIVMFIVFLFLFRIEDDLPRVERELQDRKVAECAAKGIEYIPADELERREIEAQEKEAEEIRVKELREKCQKKGLDFYKENQKILDKRAAKEAKKAAKEAKAAAKAAKKK